MKKVLLLLIWVIVTIESVCAATVSDYFDKGAVYSGSSFPIDVSKAADNNLPPIKNLKRGESVTNNILGLVETGDRGIQAAAKNGGITQIIYVDSKVSKVYIPLGFIPIYVKQTKTIVYGE